MSLRCAATLAVCACACAPRGPAPGEVPHPPPATTAGQGAPVPAPVSSSFDTIGRPSAADCSHTPSSPGCPSVPALASYALPPIPHLDGPLRPRFTYPSANQLITVRDSNFVLGSVGSGDAKLTINGIDVPVHPNGAFLTWLPVPSGDRPRYELLASKGTETASATIPVRVPAPAVALPDTGRLVVDSASVAPRAPLVVRLDERVRVSVRAPANADVTLRDATGAQTPLVRATGLTWAADIPGGALYRPTSLRIRRGHDSVFLPVDAVGLTDPGAPRFAELKNVNLEATSDTDEVAIARPAPGGTYKWFLFPQTRVEITGTRGTFLRMRLDSQLEVWAETSAVNLLPTGTLAPRRIAGNGRVVAGKGWSEVRIPVTERAPYLVEEGERSFVVTLYGTTSDVDIVNFASGDPIVRDVTWEQVASDRLKLTVHLRHAPFGYLAMWERGAFVLRVRRPPFVDPIRPLAGRTIAIDPGHPPIGSTGPTGLYEGDAVLGVALQLMAMLDSAGATVVITRITPAAVPLSLRPMIARRADADALVSIHLNALPDGANPLRPTTGIGTGTYFFHTHSEPLARFVQRGMVRSMGLRDLGINYDNLALARPTWMPAILAEGAFLIIPEQEAALRTADFQKRYAAGVLEGLEGYFRQLSLASMPR